MEQMRFTLDLPPPLPDIDLELDVNLDFDIGPDGESGGSASTSRYRGNIKHHPSESAVDTGSAYQRGGASARGQFLDGYVASTSILRRVFARSYCLRT